MAHAASAADRRFRAAVEAGAVAAGDFDHRAHLRLAYTVLVAHDPEAAVAVVRDALAALLRANGIDPSAKYHETMTRAWVLAVRAFMDRAAPCASADAFLAASPALLDPAAMGTHYSDAVLFSDAARARFVAPDLDPIPGPAADGEPTRARRATA